MTPSVLSAAGDKLPAELTLELSAQGGHVGFVASRGPLGLLPSYWLEARIGAFLRQHLA
jgi:hypothetical protein